MPDTVAMIALRGRHDDSGLEFLSTLCIGVGKGLDCAIVNTNAQNWSMQEVIRSRSFNAKLVAALYDYQRSLDAEIRRASESNFFGIRNCIEHFSNGLNLAGPSLMDCGADDMAANSIFNEIFASCERVRNGSSQEQEILVLLELMKKLDCNQNRKVA